MLSTVKTFDALGFLVHDEKSQFHPSQKITYLGFVVNSREMSVRLTDKRKRKLRDSCSDLLKKTKSKIRKVASCVGLMLSSFAGVPHGPLHYRALELDKNSALKKNKGN